MREAAPTDFAAQFVTAGPGQLACNEGVDVAYPQQAPGFADDPIRDGESGVEPQAAPKVRGAVILLLMTIAAFIGQ